MISHGVKHVIDLFPTPMGLAFHVVAQGGSYVAVCATPEMQHRLKNDLFEKLMMGLVDPNNKKTYNLRMDQNENFGTCRSVATCLIDDEDPDRGFWLANIDNTNPFAPEIKVFDFN